ncbi:MAG: NAD-binding protein [Magnetococcales bacterium]|nr:NAD-binding protein [Magnetococcales bacterium]
MSHYVFGVTARLCVAGYFETAQPGNGLMAKSTGRMGRLKGFFYHLLEDPDSHPREIFNLLMMGVVMASVVIMVWEVDPDITPYERYIFAAMEDIFITLFLIEYILRFWVCSDFGGDYLSEYTRVRRRVYNISKWRAFWVAFRYAAAAKWRWMIQPLSLVDLLAILPMMRAFRLFRVLRVLRVLKVFRYSKRLSFFTGLVQERSYELVSLLTVGVVVWGMVAVAFYTVERGHNDSMDSLWEAVYWSIITITTVGYGDITPATQTGRVIAVAGTLLGMWVVVFMTSIIVSALTERIVFLREHRMERRVDRLKNHFIVCGLDALGRAVCRNLEEESIPFVAVDDDQAKVDEALGEGWVALRGDVTEERLWTQLGLPRARSVISAIVDEASNVYIILMVRERRPDIFIVACGEGRYSEKRLKRVGADRVITPYNISGRQMVHTALRPNAVKLFDTALMRGRVELDMEELTLPVGSPYHDLTLRDSNIRGSFDVIIVGIVPGEGAVRFNPTAESKLQVGDTLICLGHLDDLTRLRGSLTGAQEGAGSRRRAG